MYDVSSNLVERLSNPDLLSADIIPWGSPIPSFGDLEEATVATLGLNPSNLEFVDKNGIELVESQRRFETLNSLGISSWGKVDESHLKLIVESCRCYFNRNPYDRWFKSLDYIVSGTRASYYCGINKACHLDLIPYATKCKWTDLTTQQKTILYKVAGDTLALLLRDSSVATLILNGNSVVKGFQSISTTNLKKIEMHDWLLPRKNGGVKGYAYTGYVDELSCIKLNSRIRVLGFNHNIQSSFGVTGKVKSSIRDWIEKETT